MKTGRIILGAIGLLALGLSACTVTVDEGNPPPRPRPGGMCPKIYMPVCAEGYGERQTLPNECVAESRGFRVLYGGECRSRPPRPPRPEPLPGDAVVCPMIHAPVCARQGGVFRTFSNSCIAEASGFRVVEDGEC